MPYYKPARRKCQEKSLPFWKKNLKNLEAFIMVICDFGALGELGRLPFAEWQRRRSPTEAK